MRKHMKTKDRAFGCARVRRGGGALARGVGRVCRGAALVFALGVVARLAGSNDILHVSTGTLAKQDLFTDRVFEQGAFECVSFERRAFRTRVAISREPLTGGDA